MSPAQGNAISPKLFTPWLKNVTMACVHAYNKYIIVCWLLLFLFDSCTWMPVDITSACESNNTNDDLVCQFESQIQLALSTMIWYFKQSMSNTRTRQNDPKQWRRREIQFRLYRFIVNVDWTSYVATISKYDPKDSCFIDYFVSLPYSPEPLALSPPKM